jgi:type IV pilus assembly protein PilQ
MMIKRVKPTLKTNRPGARERGVNRARRLGGSAVALTLLLGAPPVFGLQASSAPAMTVTPTESDSSAPSPGAATSGAAAPGAVPVGPPPPSPQAGGMGGTMILPPSGSSSMPHGGAPKKRYTGRRIDLDFRGADIHNILRLLSDVGQVNIVTSDDVKGEVTIKMKNVPWDQAMDVILRAKLLGQVREGNLIRVAPLAVLEKEIEQDIARQRQMNDVLPTETRLLGISYADARALQDRVKDLLSPRGRVSVDERTNQLIVSDVTRNLQLIEDLVHNLDTQTSQVIIEARIVEASSNFVRQIGVQWGGSTFRDVNHANPTGLSFPYNIAAAGGAVDANTQKSGLSGAGAASPDFAVNLPASVGSGSGGALGLMLGSVNGAFNLNLRLSALETTGQVRILSSPRISTLDNVEASINQGVSIPISIISAQGIQTVFVEANLGLTVKPHVTHEGTVVMTIHVTRNEPDFVNTGARGDPTIRRKDAKTVMLVQDGETAVIGGIYQRNSGLSFAKVPFFGDLPFIGFFFRNRKENDDREEFLVFITPRIANVAKRSTAFAP